MCGINGFIGQNREKLNQMNKVLSHRGPDFSGVFYDKNVSLGHTLLSIREATDLSRQPFSKEGSPWILIFNGQIYNTKELKVSLGSEYQNVDLDTALLFATIEKRGLSFIEAIHGMFAIALYNKVEQKLYLYRDSSGQKNIYYYTDGKIFCFSSEIKGLFEYGIPKEVDTFGVSVAGSLGYIPGERTIIKNVRKLSPGSMITLDCKNLNIKLSYFSENSKNYYGNKNPREVIENLVHEHFQSKQKVAINLSGGLDSSILLHEAKNAGHELLTYTNYFENCDEKYNRDALLAKKLAKDYGAIHTEIVITKKDFLDSFIESYEIIEEPNYNITLPAYFLTAKKEGVSGDKNRVILSGDGGDEVFGGYSDYLKSKEMDFYRHLITPFLFDYIKNKRNKTLDYYHFGDTTERWLFFKKLSFNATKDSSGIKDYLRENYETYARAYAVKKGSEYNMMLGDRIFWLPGENFIRSDKLYMSQSLEMRSPFAYQPFRTYMDLLLKECDYVSKKQNKNFIRKLYEGVLPEYITKREDKSGWRAPVVTWYDEEFKNLFLLVFNEAKSKSSGLVDWSKIIALVENKSGWPGKYTHLYFSLAILSKKFNLSL